MKLLKILLIIFINISILFFFLTKMHEYSWNAKDHSLYVVRLKEREKNGEIDPLKNGLSIKEHKEISDLNSDKFAFFKWCMILLIPVELIIYKGFKIYYIKRRIPK